ncbi:IS630 transposase-related protein [Wolbachia endosymbiont of Bemisia tabaci]|uniref:IS630 transposase-related protein n=1 Tax=Wolbachia endosymbiont of Bemisia tabaci TaxID=215173 RepID=UPI000D55CC60
MASPYQYELRKRVISAVESGMTVVKAKEIFKVGSATPCIRWIVRSNIVEVIPILL